MHKSKVVWVNRVLGNHLRMYVDIREPCAAVRVEWMVAARGDVISQHLEAGGQLPQGLSARGVVPDEYRFVELGDRIGTNAPTFIRAILVGDADVAPLSVPYPAVKRTLD